MIFPECKHIYHKDCIVQWLGMGNNLCPMCKCDVKEQIKRLPEKVDLSGKLLKHLISTSQKHGNNNTSNLPQNAHNHATNNANNQANNCPHNPANNDRNLNPIYSVQPGRNQTRNEA